MNGTFSLILALARASWRGWRARPFFALLNVAGLTIGVAVYLAIRIVNHSATKSFQAGVDLVAGRSDLEIVATAGDGVDEELLPLVLKTPGVRAATPVVETHAVIAELPGEYLRVLGVDPFTSAPFLEPWKSGGGLAWPGSENWLERGGGILVNAAWAEKHGLRPGAKLTLSLRGREETVEVTGFFQPEEDDAASTRAAFLDIGWAQELFQNAGRLDSIQIIADDPAKADAAADALNALLPPGARAQAPEQRSRQVGLMLQGFQLNLTALSLVSLLVGVFLIGGTTAASVVRQRREIGVLRAVGAARWQIRGIFLGEAALSALLGGLLGIPAAQWIAGLLLEGVSRTISLHYVLLSIEKTHLSGWHVAQALGCALAAAVGGAWLPAREASALDPAAVLRPGRSVDPRPPRPFVSIVSAAALFAGAFWTSWQALRAGPAWLSFGACLLLVLGFVKLARPAAAWCCGVAEKLAARRGFGRALLLRAGAAQFRRSLHRCAPVVASLLIAVAMVLGVTIMIHSFRGTLTVWVEGTLRADLYLAPAANEIVRANATLPDDLVGFLRADPRVASVETLYEDRVFLTNKDGEGEYALRVLERSRDLPFAFTGSGGEEKYARWFLPDHVAVSEILAGKMNWNAGDAVTLPTPRGPRTFTVAGVFYDYSDDRGCLYISRENHARYWTGAGVHSAAARLRDPALAAAVEDEARARFAAQTPGGLAIHANAALRKRVYDIFDQTFAVTELLRVIAIGVALLGITLTLSTLVAERAWDIAVLRGVGAGRGQVAGIHLSEAGLIGLVSALLGMACGVLLSLILTWVVNRAFFGWTVRFAMPWGELLATPLWVTAAALLAGLVPAWKAAGVRLAEALRTE